MGIENYINEIHTNGFTILKSVIDHSKVNEIKSKIVELNTKVKKPDIKHSPRLNKGSKILYNPEMKSRLFSKTIFSISDLKLILMHFLNDKWYKQIPPNKPNYILRAMIARSSLNEKLPMHIDSFIPSKGKYSFVMQSALILDDQNENNGCTIVVPGSHLYDEYATQESLANAIPIISSAGDLVIWDSRLWHGAIENNSKKDRWSLISTFTRWWIKQNYQITNELPKDIYDDLSTEEKTIMGFCCSPPRDEYERIDIKAGYEILKID